MMQYDELFNTFMPFIKKKLDAWMKKNNDVSEIIVAQQLYLIAKEIHIWGNRLEEKYNSKLKEG